MMFDFDGFQEAVFRAYLEKKEGNGLPTELEKPTRAKLREYSLRKWMTNPLGKDREVVSTFFSARGGDDDGIEASIRRFDVEKFRPLINYLNGDTAQTHERNIKLLAWLIDFEPRPYATWRETKGQIPDAGSAQDDAREGNDSTGMGSEAYQAPEPAPDTIRGAFSGLSISKTRPARRKNQKRIAGLLVVLFAILWGTLFFSMGRWSKQCMYWDGYHYVAIRCEGEGPVGAERIALDRHQLQNFRKITRPDTLTIEHANKVWYSKISNTVEFFTAPGFHPVHRERALRVASSHIIKQYAGDSEVD